LLEGSEERLGVREFFFLPGQRDLGCTCPMCLSAMEISSFPLIPPGSLLVISAGAVEEIHRPALREKFLVWLLEKEISCVAFADGQEPPEEIKRFCVESNIALFSSSFDEPYLLSRVTGLIREKILKTVTIHGVLVNLYDLGLLITGEAGAGKTTCGLALAKRGHIWIADDLIEVVKKGRRLYGRGYGSTGNVVALRDQGIVECRSYPGVSRVESASRLRLWCELKGEPEMSGMEEERAIMDVLLPFSTFPSFVFHGDTPTLIENWAKAFTAPKEMS
jgi:serine kinase of HPr protein (carbohydrate metabolism regulator)